MTETLRVEAIVLGRVQKTRQWEYKLLGLHHGCMLAYTYVKKGQTAASLDIFDHCECVLEPFASGKLYSLKDVDLLRHHGGIAKGYGPLVHASALANLLWENRDLLEGSEALFQLCLKAFGALELSAVPELVYMKALYKWLQLEGYPVKEQWLASYPQGQESPVRLLFEDLKTLQVDKARLKHCIASLQLWATQHTPLIVHPL